MSDKKRAVQFLPFNGLRGYDEMIRKKTEDKGTKEGNIRKKGSLS